MKKSLRHAFKKQDNYDTPSCLVRMLVPFLKIWQDNFVKENGRKPFIWCPFDRLESNYVTILRENGFEVLFTHIDYGQDFFNYEPTKWDIVVSNPPFSKKLDVMKKLSVSNKPYVLLTNIMCINYQEIGEWFYKLGLDVQFIIPDKKISFDGKASSFCSGYVCYKFIEKTCFVHLSDNNTGKYYRK